MLSGIAEDFDHEVRRAIDDEWLLVEVRCGVDETQKLDDAFDAVEVAIDGVLELGDDIERGQACQRRLQGLVILLPVR